MTVRILLAKQLEDSVNADWTVTLTGGNQPVAGRKLYVLTGSWNGIGNTVVGVSDDQSTSYGRRDDTTATGLTRVMIWGGDYAGSGDCTIDIDLAGAGTFGLYGWVSVIEVDDLISSENDTGARGSAQGSTSGVDASATGAGNTAQANNLYLSVMAVNTSDATANIAVPSGWTGIFTESDGGAHECGGAAYLYVTSIGTPSAAWSYDDTGAGWQATVVALKQVTVATGGAGMLMGVG